MNKVQQVWGTSYIIPSSPRQLRGDYLHVYSNIVIREDRDTSRKH